MLMADDGSTLASGQLNVKDIPVGNDTALGTVSVALQNVHAPAHCKLLIAVERGLQAASPAERGSGVNAAPRTRFENGWDIWIYPAQVALETPKDVLVTSRLDEQAEKQLQSGGKVLLTLPPESIRNFTNAPVRLVSPAFSGAPPGPNASHQPPWAFFAIRSIRRWPNSRRTSTATGNGGISSTARARCGSTSCPKKSNRLCG